MALFWSRIVVRMDVGGCCHCPCSAWSHRVRIRRDGAPGNSRGSRGAARGTSSRNWLGGCRGDRPASQEQRAAPLRAIAGSLVCGTPLPLDTTRKCRRPAARPLPLSLHCPSCNVHSRPGGRGNCFQTQPACQLQPAFLLTGPLVLVPYSLDVRPSSSRVLRSYYELALGTVPCSFETCTAHLGSC